MKKLIFLLVGLSLLSCSKKWEKEMENDFPQMSSEWDTPKLLGITNLGWLESIECSEDGDTLYYMYYPGEDLVTDTRKEKWVGTAQIWYSVRDANQDFTSHQPMFGTEIGIHETTGASGTHVDAGNNLWFSSNYEALTTGDWENENLYRNDSLLAFNIPDATFGNPHYCAATDELWFDGVIDQEIWVLYDAAANNFSGTAEKAPEPISDNSEGAQNMQPWLSADGQIMYFSSNRNRIGERFDGPEIMKSVRNLDGSWSTPTAVVTCKIAVGDACLTADGTKIFFCQHLKKGNQYRTAVYEASLK